MATLKWLHGKCMSAGKILSPTTRCLVSSLLFVCLFEQFHFISNNVFAHRQHRRSIHVSCCNENENAYIDTVCLDSIALDTSLDSSASGCCIDIGKRKHRIFVKMCYSNGLKHPLRFSVAITAANDGTTAKQHHAISHILLLCTRIYDTGMTSNCACNSLNWDTLSAPTSIIHTYIVCSALSLSFNFAPFLSPWIVVNGKNCCNSTHFVLVMKLSKWNAFPNAILLFI